MWKNLGAAALAAMIASPALAGGVEEVRAGVSIQSFSGIAENLEDGVALGGEVMFASPKLIRWAFKPRVHVGGSLALDEAATSYGYAGLTWRIAPPVSRFHLDFGVGGAVHDGPTDFNAAVDLPRQQRNAFLGCRGLFRLHASPGVRIAPRVTANIQYEHLSNAGLCDENEGLDNLGFRLGVRF